MPSVRVFQVDAFTARRFAGNPAGVVLDADALSAQQMRALARELGSADTAFVLDPDGSDHDVRVRFFTPRGETGFIGHATLAVHAVLASLGEPPRPRQKQSVGNVRVDLLASEPVPRIAVHQSPPELRGPLPPAALAELLDALSLTAAELDPRCPPVLAGAGSARVLLGINEAASLARLQPDLPRLAQLSGRLGAPGILLFTLAPSVPDVTTEARMLCPALGFPEDPVSGNAHALLGMYLLQQGRLTPRAAPPESVGVLEFTGAQGHHMERPGRVTVALTLEGTTPTSVTIIGEAVVVFATTVPV